jgi:hypothetical protein
MMRKYLQDHPCLVRVNGQEEGFERPNGKVHCQIALSMVRCLVLTYGKRGMVRCLVLTYGKRGMVRCLVLTYEMGNGPLLGPYLRKEGNGPLLGPYLREEGNGPLLGPYLREGQWSVTWYYLRPGLVFTYGK